MTYHVDLASLEWNFPEGFQVPSLLREFEEWLRDRPCQSLGNFSFSSDRINDFWYENGSDLHSHFAFFLQEGSGGQIGYWIQDKDHPDSSPIVYLGSEGELEILSETLEQFLILLAKGKTPLTDPEDPDIDDNCQRELLEWLASRGYQGNGFKEKRFDSTLLEVWMNEWSQQQRDRIDKHPALLEIADHLRKFTTFKGDPWETKCFDVLLVGTQFQMWQRKFGPIPMESEKVIGLEPFFRAVREERAHDFPERGLWFSAWIEIRSEGGANLCCNFMDEPKIMDEPLSIPLSDYELDMARFPRSKHWMPRWYKGNS